MSARTFAPLTPETTPPTYFHHIRDGTPTTSTHTLTLSLDVLVVASAGVDVVPPEVGGVPVAFGKETFWPSSFAVSLICFAKAFSESADWPLLMLAWYVLSSLVRSARSLTAAALADVSVAEVAVLVIALVMTF